MDKLTETVTVTREITGPIRGRLSASGEGAIDE
jgi:hypothetical protein